MAHHLRPLHLHLLLQLLFRMMQCKLNKKKNNSECSFICSHCFFLFISPTSFDPHPLHASLLIPSNSALLPHVASVFHP
jgi:hypothetical protein